MDKILSMIRLDEKTPKEIAADLAARVRARRKELGLSQEKLAQKSQVSLGSLKRFESKYEISLSSLLRIAIALDAEEDFDSLFFRKQYRSIQDVIDEQA